MKVGVKYCGGCNSSYDRKGMVERLSTEFKHNFQLANEEEMYDIILVLCGCTSGCASHEHLHSKYGRIIVRSEDDYDKVVDLINSVPKLS